MLCVYDVTCQDIPEVVVAIIGKGFAHTHGGLWNGPMSASPLLLIETESHLLSTSPVVVDNGLIQPSHVEIFVIFLGGESSLP
jgi:hypothetical protein